jgi:hypothetical protein
VLASALEHAPKKLLDFFDMDMVQLTDFERSPLQYRNLVHVRSWDSLEIVHKIQENQRIKSRRRKRFQDANLHLFSM